MDAKDFANWLSTGMAGETLTRGAAALGGGIGNYINTLDFDEAKAAASEAADKYDAWLENRNPVVRNAAGFVSGLANPGGRVGKALSLMRGENPFSGRDTTRSNVVMPDGTIIKSTKKPKDSEMQQIQLSNGNVARLLKGKKNESGGYDYEISHPELGAHTKMNLHPDKEGLQSVNYNFRQKGFEDAPQAKGTSQELKAKLAEMLGGIGSDMTGQTSPHAAKSWLRDENTIQLRPNQSKEKPTQDTWYYLPGNKTQSNKAKKSVEASYPGVDLKAGDRTTQNSYTTQVNLDDRPVDIERRVRAIYHDRNPFQGSIRDGQAFIEHGNNTRLRFNEKTAELRERYGSKENPDLNAYFKELMRAVGAKP